MAELGTSGSIINTARELLTMFERTEQAADLIREGDKRYDGMRGMDRQNITREAIASRVWRREGRQVLVMHPGIVDEVKIANSDRISGRVLQTLPFMSPMVAYASPPEFATWINPDAEGVVAGEAALRLLGFMTFAHAPLESDGENWQKVKASFDSAMNRLTKLQVTPNKPLYDLFEPVIFNTHDERAQDFGIAALFHVVDKLGRRIDWQISLLSIPLYREGTFSEIVDSLIERFDFAVGHSNDTNGNKQSKRWMREVMSTIVGTLFYLCSTTLEAEDIDKLPRKQAQKIVQQGRKAPSVYRVGWKMGAALTALRHAATNNPDGSLLPGREQDPQHRRGHFKMQPYGPNNSLRKLILVAPYWTKAEKLHLYDIKTVRRVPHPGSKGAAREAMRSALGVSNAIQEEVGTE